MQLKIATVDVQKFKEDVKKMRENVKKIKTLDTRIEALNKLPISKRYFFSSQTFSVPRKGQNDAM